MPRPEPIAEIVRSGFVEGHHYGSVVALASDGSVDWSVGDVESQILPRSCNKPIQAVAMVRAGLRLEGELLALTAASHSGEGFHLEGVRRILGGAGLDESKLQTPPDYPLDDEARDAWVQSGRARSPLAMNCSGKHAAMLATCVVNGWSVDDYLRPDHPLQRSIRTTFEELTGEPVLTVAVDGCGAPLLSTALRGLALAFRRIATAQNGPERAVADAIGTFPEFTSGSRRDEARLLRSLPGAIGKAGAESCYVLATADGRAVALKTDDGAARVRAGLMVASLARAGISLAHPLRGGLPTARGGADILGGGAVVGEVRVAL